MNLVGFHNPLTIAPTQVIPLFIDQQSDTNTSHFVQRISHNQLVTEFQKLRTKEQLNFISHIGEYCNLATGDSATYAFQVSENSVEIFKDFELFKNFMIEALTKKKFEKFPFVELDMAKQCGAMDIEIRVAEKCVRSILDHSPHIAASWVSYGVLSPEARLAARIALSEAAKFDFDKQTAIEPEIDEEVEEIWFSFNTFNEVLIPISNDSVSVVKFDIRSFVARQASCSRLVISHRDRVEIDREEEIEKQILEWRNRGGKVIQINVADVGGDGEVIPQNIEYVDKIIVKKSRIEISDEILVLLGGNT